MADVSDSSASNNNNSTTQVNIPVYRSDDDKAGQVVVMALHQAIQAEESCAAHVPATFACLLAVFRDTYGPNTATSFDLAALFAHLILLEHGFINHGSTASFELYPSVDFHYKRTLLESQKVPAKPFKIQDSCYSITYQLGPFGDVPCKLVATKFDTNQVVLNGHIPPLGRFYSLIVDVSLYVVPMRGSFVYQGMLGFARRVKAELCAPMRNDVLRSKRVAPNTLNNLPEEMLNYLRGFLCAADDRCLITCLYGAEVAEQLEECAVVVRRPIGEIRWRFSQTTL